MPRTTTVAALLFSLVGAARADVLFDSTNLQPNSAFGMSRSYFGGGSDYTVGQAFRTGTIDSVLDRASLLLDIHATGSEASPTTLLDVRIFTDASGTWEGSLGTLTNPTLVASDEGPRLYEFGGNGIRLAADTDYWLVARNLEGMAFWMGSITPGRSVNYVPPRISTQMVQDDLTMVARIEASPVPEPASLVALGAGVATLLRRRRKGSA